MRKLVTIVAQSAEHRRRLRGRMASRHDMPRLAINSHSRSTPVPPPGRNDGPDCLDHANDCGCSGHRRDGSRKGRCQESEEHHRGRSIDIGQRLLARALDADRTRTAIGVDVTFDMLRQAAQRLPQTVLLICASGDNVPLRGASADVVVSTSTLHYLRDPIGMLSEAFRLLVPGGTVVAGDWCRDYWTMIAIDRVPRWVDPAHVATRSGETLVRWKRNAGFQNVRLSRQRIDGSWGTMTASAQRPCENPGGP